MKTILFHCWWSPTSNIIMFLSPSFSIYFQLVYVCILMSLDVNSFLMWELFTYITLRGAMIMCSFPYGMVFMVNGKNSKIHRCKMQYLIASIRSNTYMSINHDETIESFKGWKIKSWEFVTTYAQQFMNLMFLNLLLPIWYIGWFSI